MSTGALTVGCNSKLNNIKLQTGMPRSEVEKLVSNALGQEYSYDFYRADLEKDSVVKYEEENRILEVTYERGYFPPSGVFTARGVFESPSPIDQKVKSFRLYKKNEHQ